jgi:serine/threonine protein kinase
MVDGSWGEKSDVWAVGVLSYELLSKLKPFDNFTGDHAEIWN